MAIYRQSSFHYLSATYRRKELKPLNRLLDIDCVLIFAAADFPPAKFADLVDLLKYREDSS